MSSMIICPGCVALRVAVAVPDEDWRLATITVLPAVNVPTQTVFIAVGVTTALELNVPNWYWVPARLVNLIRLVIVVVLPPVVTCGS